MAATFTLVSSVAKSNGLMEVVGTCVLDSSYANGGEVLDLSTYFKSTSSPAIIIQAQSATYGYRHDGGTSSGGKVVAYVLADGSSPDSANLSAVVGVVYAVGQQAGTS